MAIYSEAEYCSVMTARSPIPFFPLGLRWLAGSTLVLGYCLLAASPVFKWDRAYLPQSRRSEPESRVAPSAPSTLQDKPAPAELPTAPKDATPEVPQGAEPSDLSDKTAPRETIEAEPDSESATPSAPVVPQPAPAPQVQAPRPPSIQALTTPRAPEPQHAALPQADTPTPSSQNSALLATVPPESFVPVPARLAEALLPTPQNGDFLATVPPEVWVPTPGGLSAELPDGVDGAPSLSGPPVVATAPLPEPPEARPNLPSNVVPPPSRPPSDAVPTVSGPLPAPDVTVPSDNIAPPDVTVPPSASPAAPPPDDQIFVQQFQILGSTVFSQQQLAEAALTAVGLDPSEILSSPGSSRVLTTRGLTLAELVQAGDAITQLYLDAGYISSGAYLDQDSIESDSPILQIIEGQLEEIAVTLVTPEQTIAIQTLPEALRSPEPLPWQPLSGVEPSGIVIGDTDLTPIDLTDIGADSSASRLGDPATLTLAVAQNINPEPYRSLNPDSTARQIVPLPEREAIASLRFEPEAEAWRTEYAPYSGTRWFEFTGIQPLDPGYIGSRLALAGEAPLNIDRLVEGVQLLQLDPVIDQIATEITEGSGLGTSRLNVRATQADTDQFQFSYDNSRSPSVGSIRQGARFTQGNLLGFGDSLQLSFGRSQGSEDWDVLYTLPLGPYDTTLTFNVGASTGEILDEIFSALDIISATRYTDITLRQPLYQTPTDEFALSLGLSHTETQSTFLGGLGFPSSGADGDGFLRISALRFGQDWVRREANQVIALQSTFSLGLDTLGATINDEPPDSQFQSWQGSAQWARLLAPDFLLLIGGSLQFADRQLPPTEQISVGGVSTVRGYRQNTILADNGWTASAELQIPVLRIPEIGGLLQVAPFFDAGGGFLSANRSSSDTTTLDVSNIASVGLGVIWSQSDYLNARLDWGLPLTTVETTGNTLQESGIHFSIIFTPPF